jgi:hypothetical protein
MKFGARDKGGIVSYFDGDIDELRFAAIIATPSEIKADYNSGNDSLITFEVVP